MDSRLEVLTQRLYEQGLERGRSDGASIVDRARAEAAEILSAAREEARSILEKARADAEDARKRSAAEISVASQQALSALKQEVVYLMSRSSLKDDVERALDEPADFLEVVKEAVRSALSGGLGSRDLVVQFPENARKTLERVAAEHMREQLEAGLQLNFAGRFAHGFTIGPKSGEYQVSFTDADFLQFFQGYLKARTRDILFPGA